jgi:hypothetical protein
MKKTGFKLNEETEPQETLQQQQILAQQQQQLAQQLQQQQQQQQQQQHLQFQQLQQQLFHQNLQQPLLQLQQQQKQQEILEQQDIMYLPSEQQSPLQQLLMSAQQQQQLPSQPVVTPAKPKTPLSRSREREGASTPGGSSSPSRGSVNLTESPLPSLPLSLLLKEGQLQQGSMIHSPSLMRSSKDMINGPVSHGFFILLYYYITIKKEFVKFCKPCKLTPFLLPDPLKRFVSISIMDFSEGIWMNAQRRPNQPSVT